MSTFGRFRLWTSFESSPVSVKSFSQKCREFGARIDDCADYVIEPVLEKLTNSTTGANLYNVNLFGCKDELFMYIVSLDCLKKWSGKLENRVTSRILYFCDSGSEKMRSHQRDTTNPTASLHLGELYSER